MLFGSLDLEYSALEFGSLSKYLRTFVQDGGGFALVGLVIWLIVSGSRALSARGPFRFIVPLPVLGAILASAILYGAGAAGAQFGGAKASTSQDPFLLLENPPDVGKWWDWCFTIGGCIALAGVVVPFLLDCAKLRFRRICALARLTVLEAIRGRIIWAFLIVLIPFMFPAKWFFLLKPESELNATIKYFHFFLSFMFLLAGGFTASFSIPTDIRQQTIHTIVTKPVERFEIVVGRFVGHLGLMSAMLLAVTTFGWVLTMVSNVDPESKEESMKARVPIYGDLGFQGPPGSRFQGESVGREHDRRRYVPGGANSPYRATWAYFEQQLPRELAAMPNQAVRCEFNFDIFRTTKGEENKGVSCTFFFITHEANRNFAAIREEYHRRLKDERIIGTAQPDGKPAERADWPRLVKLAGELGYYEFAGKEVVDYHTLWINVPAPLFSKAYEGSPEKVDHPERGRIDSARFFVAVRCDSRTQFIGVKPNDLYLLAKEESFHLNYFKGVGGIWLRLCLVIGIAVTCSTYLNGIVSFLVTLFLVGLGFFRGFIIYMALLPFSTDVANPGPTDSLRKLITNESLGTSSDTTSPTQQVTLAMDEGFRWCLRRLLNVVPNVERLTWTDYVANGFNVPLDDLSLNGLMVGGYLLLWALLGHYLIKWREVATW